MIRGMILDELGQTCILLLPSLKFRRLIVFQRLIHNILFFMLFMFFGFPERFCHTYQVSGKRQEYVEAGARRSNVSKHIKRCKLQLHTTCTLEYAMCRHYNAHCTSLPLANYNHLQLSTMILSSCVAVSLHGSDFQDFLTLTQALTW